VNREREHSGENANLKYEATLARKIAQILPVQPRKLP